RPSPGVLRTRAMRSRVAVDRSDHECRYNVPSICQAQTIPGGVSVSIFQPVVPSRDRRGGGASKRHCEAPFERATGVVILELTTPSVPTKGCLRRYCLMARRPLLSQEGTTGCKMETETLPLPSYFPILQKHCTQRWHSQVCGPRAAVRCDFLGFD